MSACRRCGRSLTDVVDLYDGVCSDGRASEPTCAHRCYLWAQKHRPASIHESLLSPEWKVTVDEWLAAGAP